ncbi:glycosyltransferase family 2 protein [Albidovulum sediminicola]|uniref:Glycosyltransferase family 2 protein n=1 Tax=Albidovulum sediminicola TaxID=2984331 RepID=A0ABT2Z7D4_9RHOB|nr:glycosyltransferase family 2 protein [Defluviimonas sp. WL0075]MCV2866932.1 glycosyltransferase family 2 protein [Defluviimonas sp. WL0075]
MTTNSPVDVSFVMPCLNESATLVQCIDAAKQAIARLETDFGMSGEILIADNGSTDGSQDLARSAGALVVDIKERGYGAALRGGIAASRGRFIVMGDSDMSYDFRQAVPMIEKLRDGDDLCMGSRFKGEILPGAMPWKNRYIGNPVLSAILRLLFRTAISDSHCGLRGITREAFDDLKLTANGMEFASEMVLKAALRRLKTSEVPVTLSPDGRGRPPHLSPWRDGFRHLFYMLMLSPSWLYLLPSAILYVVGFTILVNLLANPGGNMVQIGRIQIGDHWTVVGASSLIIATQTVIFWLATQITGIRSGYFPATPTINRVLEHSTLGTWILAGLGVGTLGFVWVASIAAGWIYSGFGPLEQMRPLITAFTAVVIGAQLFFGGFLLSIVAGNKLRHRVSVSPDHT